MFASPGIFGVSVTEQTCNVFLQECILVPANLPFWTKYWTLLVFLQVVLLSFNPVVVFMSGVLHHLLRGPANCHPLGEEWGASGVCPRCPDSGEGFQITSVEHQKNYF